MRRQILKEAFLATIILIGIGFLVSLIPFKSDFLRPIKQELGDFDIYDLFYSGNAKENFGDKDSKIILIQVATDPENITRQREKIARQIEQINALEPKVLGIDVSFSDASDPASIRLKNAMTSHQQNVTSYILTNPKKGSVKIEDNFLSENDYMEKGGFVNTPYDTNYSVIRKFYPAFKGVQKDYYSFSAQVAKKYDEKKFNTLIARKNLAEDINYTGGLNHYQIYSEKGWEDINSQKDSIEMKRIKGKIVLLGFFTTEQESPVMEDLNFTPLNEKTGGKSFPDSYGIVIHANIISMILSEDGYIHSAKKWVSYLISFFLVLSILYFIFLYHHKFGHPMHLLLLLLQVFSIILFTWFFLKLFDWFQWKINLTPIILSIVISVELYDIYARIAGWMHKKFGYNTIFTNH